MMAQAITVDELGAECAGAIRSALVLKQPAQTGSMRPRIYFQTWCGWCCTGGGAEAFGTTPRAAWKTWCIRKDLLSLGLQQSPDGSIVPIANATELHLSTQ